MTKLRIFLRRGYEDCNDTFEGYTYSSVIVEVEDKHKFHEVIGGEWITEEKLKDGDNVTE